MDEQACSRRSLLGGAAGLVTLAGSAGCLDGVPFLGDEQGGPATVELGPVPKDVDLLVRADGDELLDDEGLRRVVTAGLDARTEGGTHGPGTTDELIEAVDVVYGLDPTVVTVATGFSTIATENPIDSMAGAIVEADWDPDAIQANLTEAGFPSVERSREGMTVYDVRDEISLVGVLGDGRFVIGTEGAVHGAIDIEAGEREPLADDLLGAFRATSRGPVRFVARFPPLVDGTAALLPGSGDLIKDSLLNQLTFLAGSIQREGEERILQSRITAEGKSSAERMDVIARGALALGTASAPEDSPIPAALDEVETAVEGDEVTVSYRASVDHLETLAPPVVHWLVGTGTLGPVPADWDG